MSENNDEPILPVETLRFISTLRLMNIDLVGLVFKTEENVKHLKTTATFLEESIKRHQCYSSRPTYMGLHIFSKEELKISTNIREQAKREEGNKPKGLLENG